MMNDSAYYYSFATKSKSKAKANTSSINTSTKLSPTAIKLATGGDGGGGGGRRRNTNHKIVSKEHNKKIRHHETQAIHHKHIAEHTNHKPTKEFHKKSAVHHQIIADNLKSQTSDFSNNLNNGIVRQTKGILSRTARNLPTHGHIVSTQGIDPSTLPPDFADKILQQTKGIIDDTNNRLPTAPSPSNTTTRHNRNRNTRGNRNTNFNTIDTNVNNLPSDFASDIIQRQGGTLNNNNSSNSIPTSVQTGTGTSTSTQSRINTGHSIHSTDPNVANSIIQGTKDIINRNSRNLPASGHIVSTQGIDPSTLPPDFASDIIQRTQGTLNNTSNSLPDNGSFSSQDDQGNSLSVQNDNNDKSNFISNYAYENEYESDFLLLLGGIAILGGIYWFI